MLKVQFILWFDMNGPIDSICVALLEDLCLWGVCEYFGFKSPSQGHILSCCRSGCGSQPSAIHAAVLPIMIKKWAKP